MTLIDVVRHGDRTRVAKHKRTKPIMPVFPPAPPPLDLEDALAKLSNSELANDLDNHASALEDAKSSIATASRLLWREAAKRLRQTVLTPEVKERVDTPESSNIAAFAYGSSRLEVVFKNGGRYAYDDVSPEIFAAFKRAESKGVFFADAIKGHYPTTKLEPLDKVPALNAGT